MRLWSDSSDHDVPRLPLPGDFAAQDVLRALHGRILVTLDPPLRAERFPA